MSNHGCDCCNKIRLVPRRVIFEKPGSMVWSVPQDGWYKVYVTGGGGGSGSINLIEENLPSFPQYTTWNSGCGSAGGTAIKDLYLTAGEKVDIIVGAGGEGGDLSNQQVAYEFENATPGKTSSFGSYLSATGGSAGRSIGQKVTYQLLQGSGTSFGGGYGVDGDINYTGSAGYTGNIYDSMNTITNNVGGNSYWGSNPTPSNIAFVWENGYKPNKPKTWGNGADGVVGLQGLVGVWINIQCSGTDGADGVVLIEWTEVQ